MKYQKVEIMFCLEPTPTDPILGLTEEFRNDPSTEKINLGVGVYQNENGETPILKSVKIAEKYLFESESTKAYFGIPGEPVLGRLTQELLLGKKHSIIENSLAQTAQTPGGTGALRIAAEFISRARPKAHVWISNPSWANHQPILLGASLQIKRYRYYDAETHSLDNSGMLDDLSEANTGDVLILHGCCHNPAGVDLSSSDWENIADLASRKKLLCIVDFAYQGFGDGLIQDRNGLLTLIKKNSDLLIANSFSKNFGLYRERTGAITVISETKKDSQAAFSHIKEIIRAIYSSPPSHGGAIVSTILGDEKLKSLWLQELDEMRQRISAMRRDFVRSLKEKCPNHDFSFIEKQKGMFSFCGLSSEQVDRLKDEFHIYMVRSGRVNIAGITPSNIGRLTDAIETVL